MLVTNELDDPDVLVWNCYYCLYTNVSNFKKNSRREFKATLNFRKFKVALKLFSPFFLNFVKRCILVNVIISSSHLARL